MPQDLDLSPDGHSLVAVEVKKAIWAHCEATIAQPALS